MPTVLGLNAHHGDSAAALVRDGKLIAAAEEERFRRIKHWAGLPTEAIRFCLEQGGLRLGDVDHIAVNRRPGVNNHRRLLFVLTRWPDLRLVANRIRNIRRAASIEGALRRAFAGQPLNARVHHIEHHLAHLASAFLVSGFSEAVCLSVDGFGDFASAAWGMGRAEGLQIDGRVYFPHSLGIFYSAITQLIGFPYYGDEYKVMGLAPYGQPRYLEPMRQIVRVRSDGAFRLNLKFFRHHNQNVAYTWDNCAPEVGTLYTPELERLLGPARREGEPLDQRHKDLACSAQAMYEEAFFALLNALYGKYQCPRLALSGGCAMNSVANGKVRLKSRFAKLYLPAAAGDAGGAIGAAFTVWRRIHDSRRPILKFADPSPRPGQRTSDSQAGSGGSNGHFVMDHAYWGPGASAEEIQRLLQAKSAQIQAGHCAVEEVTDPGALCVRAANAVAEGKVVGWFQGRMEWGPRALGNRSIVCDPRRADMKNILNAKIKRRESFRPFAPSILREHVGEWFEQDDEVPFMMQVFQVRPEKRALVPATTHVDGSGRLHTVRREANPLYYQLISEFARLTSVPMVLNTSFNENEPVVCRPEEALDCFLRTKMDVLVLGSHVVKRKLTAES